MRRAKLTTVPKEDTEQEILFHWAALSEGAHPELKLLYAVPNGGYRPLLTAVRMKRTGTKAGVPDICLPVARGGYHGLYIELKRVKGGVVSENQRAWMDMLNAEGYLARVGYGSDDAIRIITSYLKGEIK